MIERRIDQILMDLFPELSRTQIQKMILGKKVHLLSESNIWEIVDRPSIKFFAHKIQFENVKIEDTALLKYVSQGALKLEKALEEFEIEVNGLLALDMGLSTGGFSDVLLQKKASRVLGLDVGRGQLHPRLKKEQRLVSYDKINGRYPISEKILADFFKDHPKKEFDLVVVDVSFISLSYIIPNLVQVLRSGGTLIALVKPQFELSKGDLNKRGVVKKQTLREEALQKIIGVFSQNALEQIRYCDSPIEEDNGNKEYLLTGIKI